MRVSVGNTSPTLNKVEGYKKVSVAEGVEGNQETATRKGATRFNGLFNDFVNELYQEKTAYMWAVRRLPWKIHPSMLINYRMILPREGEEGRGAVRKISNNIRRIAVAVVPTFPAKGEDYVEYLKIVFVHVAKLTKEAAEEILYAAARARVKILHYRQEEVRDTCVVVIADEQDKAANMHLRGMARRSNQNGSNIAYVFASRRGPYIRKLLYGFLGNYLSQRAEKVEQHGIEALQRAGANRGIYGALKDCCEFVAGLGAKLKELAGKIVLPWGARKTREEYQADRFKNVLQRPRTESEEYAAALKKMRELALAEREARHDKGRPQGSSTI